MGGGSSLADESAELTLGVQAQEGKMVWVRWDPPSSSRPECEEDTEWFWWPGIVIRKPVSLSLN